MENIIQYDSLDVARDLIDCCNSKNIKLGNTKINKLLYIVYGVYLALHEKTIISERPKYFPYGPVFPRVFKKFNSLTPIKINFPKELREVINDVVNTYGNISAGILSAWTHKEGSPWHKIQQRDGDNYGAELNDNDIYNYFKNNIIINA